MKILSYSLLLVFMMSFSSCLVYKDIVNFQDGQDLEDGVLDSIYNNNYWTIQPEDILQINIYSSNQLEAERFNIIDTRIMSQMMAQGGGGANLMEPIGYRVDIEGNIDMPVLGKIYVNGKTIEEVKDIIYKLVSDSGYLLDVNVQVRFLSFKITISGEVNAPGSFIIQSQRITILEALGLARDLTIFANRDNILIIREIEGVRKYGRLNLKSKEIFESPFFYLHPNDVVYVEPHRAKILAAPDPASRYVSTVVGVISLVTLIFALR